MSLRLKNTVADASFSPILVLFLLANPTSAKLNQSKIRQWNVFSMH